MTPMPVPPVTVAPSFTIALDRLRGGLSAEALTYVYNHAGFEQCSSTSHGTVPVSVSITPAGRARATLGRGTIRDAAYRQCIEQHITAATHPAATAATRVRVTVTRP
jgi:hypothetical protein